VDLFNILWRAALVIAAGYLLGGVPFGAVVTKRMHGVDITTLGSGNTGATNVFRSVGWRAAAIVAVADIAKGTLPALLAFFLALPSWGDSGRDLLIIAAGSAAMLGHMFSPYFRLRGGKGIATAAGAILVLMPKVLPLLILVFAGTILIVRIVSVASLLAAASFPFLTWWLYPGDMVTLVFAVAIFAVVVFSHRANIGRLARGEEPRITMGRASDQGRKES
jgi:acyl phosphate:glycerol-3-phosphate acyltransferase